MNKLFFIIITLTILFSSCGNKENTKSNVHTHEDGSVHTDHDNGTVVTPKQELFEVKNDSVEIVNDTDKSEKESEHDHSHENGHEHTH